ncbi:MAG: flavodoxin [Corynebacterium sp.]|nr:flavodoxin [Corynebacterium sp.]
MTTQVIYFSKHGHTERAAQAIAAKLGVEPHQIIERDTYSDADLNWRVDECRANQEQWNPETRVPAANADEIVELISESSVLYLGYPIWWGKAPRIIVTIAEQVQKINPNLELHIFVTSGGSGVAATAPEVQFALGASHTAKSALIHMDNIDGDVDALLS